MIEDLKIIYLPDDALPDLEELTGDLKAVARIIGVKNAMALGQIYKGVPIRLWNTEKFIRRYRDECIKRDSVNMSGVAIAKKYRLTERQIWYILGRSPEDVNGNQQMDLF